MSRSARVRVPQLESIVVLLGFAGGGQVTKVEFRDSAVAAQAQHLDVDVDVSASDVVSALNIGRCVCVCLSASAIVHS